MKKLFTKSDYKRKRREVKRTSQKLSYPKKKTKYHNGDIVKLKVGEDMGYVEYYVNDKVCIKWTDDRKEFYLEGDLIRVV